MKRFWLAPALMLVGCNSTETALIVRGALLPEDPMTCGYSADGEIFEFGTTFDSVNQETLALSLGVENNLQSGQVEFGTGGEITEIFRVPNAVSVLRADIRWECESNGFSADTGALILPTFSVDKPFCLDRREDVAGDFSGFDVVPAFGSAIAPDGAAVIRAHVISKQLGDAIDDMFDLATLANQCCTEAGGCSNEELATSPAACQQLQDAFDAVAGPSVLSAKNQVDVQKFRPFSQFDFFDPTLPRQAQVPPPSIGNIIGPSYQLLVHGVLEGITGDGTLVTSNEFAVGIGICRNCRGGGGCDAVQ